MKKGNKALKAAKTVKATQVETIETPAVETTPETTVAEVKVKGTVVDNPVHRTVNEVVAKFKNGTFNTTDVEILKEAGWTKWGCKDASLVNKTKILCTKLAQIADGTKRFDVEKTFVTLENLPPFNGRSYERISIHDLETGKVLFMVCPFEPLPGSPATVYDINVDESKPVVSGLWNSVKKYFKN